MTPPPAQRSYTVGFLHTSSPGFFAWKPTGREKCHSVTYRLFDWDHTTLSTCLYLNYCSPRTSHHCLGCIRSAAYVLYDFPNYFRYSFDRLIFRPLFFNSSCSMLSPGGIDSDSGRVQPFKPTQGSLLDAQCPKLLTWSTWASCLTLSGNWSWRCCGGMKSWGKLRGGVYGELPMPLKNTICTRNMTKICCLIFW